MAGEITLSRFEKLRMGVYFKGATCACGGEKPRHKWSCRACKAATEKTSAGIRLTRFCNAHLTAARDVLELCSERKATT